MIEAMKQVHDLSLDERHFEARQMLLDIIAEAEKQDPVGRVISASCEYATVQWLKQTSGIGGGDPKNSRSWPIAGDAVYTTPPASQKPLTDEQIEDLIRYRDLTIYEAFRLAEAAHNIKE